MKVQKIIASLFLIYPTIFYFIVAITAAAFHSLDYNLYIFLPLVLIGINIALFMRNRITMILSIILLIALISFSFLYFDLYSILTGGSLLYYLQSLSIGSEGLFSMLCLIYPLIVMIQMLMAKTVMNSTRGQV